VDGKTQQPTAVNNGSYTSGIRSEGGNGPVKRFDNPKDAYNDSYSDVHAKLNGRSSWVTPSTNINQYINKYAPKEDNNDPASYAQHAIKYFNKLLGTNNINLNSELGDIKDLLISKGYDPEHEFTKMHLQIEDPKVLSDLGKVVTTKPEVKTQPIVQVNEGPKVVTKPVVNKPTAPATPTKITRPTITPKDVGEPIIKFPTFSKSDFNIPDVEVDFNLKLTSSVGKWLYETLAPVLTSKKPDEDVLNVFEYLKNGGSIFDVQDVYDNYKAKKGGSESSDLIGESKSIVNTTSDADKVIANWGAPTLNISKESKTKSNYVVPKLKVSDSPSVDKDNYTSRSFIANLKNKDNKFTVLNNVHGGSGIGNIESFYRNFQPVDGSIVFTMQNDVVSGEKPLTTITKNDKWYEGSKYLIKLNNDNNMEVVKTSSLKEGDKVFKLKDKVFSFEDFDIKDGKINTVFDTNINALIPVVKNDAKTYKAKKEFVLGLTDKKRTAGYIPINDATQYGRSRGGSFIIFNDDLTQQYMVGGSFKNLYDFYQDLKKQYPNSDFKVFSSDTGSYSNSFFPKSGKIDGDVYKKSNIRNTWGEVQHIVLMN